MLPKFAVYLFVFLTLRFVLIVCCMHSLNVVSHWKVKMTICSISLFAASPLDMCIAETCDRLVFAKIGSMNLCGRFCMYVMNGQAA